MSSPPTLLEQVAHDLDVLGTRLRAKGFAGRVGFGKRPAVLVVDFVRGFTDPTSPLGGDFSAEVEAAACLVQAAHGAGAPVVYSTVWGASVRVRC